MREDVLLDITQEAGDSRQGASGYFCGNKDAELQKRASLTEFPCDESRDACREIKRKGETDREEY